ncbi:MAG: replication-associated recombination protein A [Rhodospirillaceae bacterium]|nr:replication-associated recombination protein A [Rhodospirillaceae bacterium]
MDILCQAWRAGDPAFHQAVSSLFKDIDSAAAPAPPAPRQPLADRLRPGDLRAVVGQSHLLDIAGPVGRMLDAGRISSVILWGPPGCGKTTIARLLAGQTDLHFETLSAVFSGVADLKKVFAAARDRSAKRKGTLLFVDEIHRFNRAQQDAFLPVVEDGTIVLVGATTENPSFELNAALLSRCQVLVLHRLDDDALETLLVRAEGEVGQSLPLDDEARSALRAMADGDGRHILALAEELLALSPQPNPMTSSDLVATLQRRAPVYDKNSEGHYNLISAVHKSLRGSDPDAALYWVSRMLDGGEDPIYILRRLARFAVEDIGLADPQAITQALVAWDTYDRLGSPEGDLAIAQLVLYLGTAPKSNAAYRAFKQAKTAAQNTGSLMPPKHILNAPTQMMKTLGYGKDYAYDHDSEDGLSGQDYFPDDMARERYYDPPDRGFEREICKRLTYWDKLRREKNAKPKDDQ